MVSLFKRVFRAKKVWIVLAVTIISAFGASYYYSHTGGQNQGSSIQPTSSTQLRAWDYVRNHLEFSVPYGTLLREYPTASTAWLNDAYLASMSMARMFPQDARGIAVALSSLNFTDSRWSALACDQEHFQGLFGLGPTPASWPSQSGVQVKAWLRNQTLFLADFNRYADLLALTVIDEQCSGNHVKALELFGQLKGMFHGIGFVDAVYEQRTVYETFKLALALIAAQKVGDQDFADKLTGLLTKQQYSLTNVDGHQYGFITDYREIGIASDNQIPTNAETTLLSLIALSPSTPLKPANGVQVGVFYYGWYGHGTFGHARHWNQTDDPCTAIAPMPAVVSSSSAVSERPLIGGDNGNGYYDSQNSNLTRAELLEMRKVGIGFILISWWGSNATNARDNYTDVSARTVFDVLRNNPNDFRGMKAAILVENYPTRFPNKPNLYKVDPGNISAVYSYISDEFVQKFPDQYFYWNGKPLILFFSPQWIVLNSIRQSPDYAQFSTRTLGDETFIDWRFAEETPVLSPDGFVTVMPRFDSYYLFKSGCRTNAIRIDVNLDYLYAQQWNAIIGRKSDLGIVAIYSWNEYHERTEIEPHMDASLKPPFQLYFQTEHYVDQIKS